MHAMSCGDEVTMCMCTFCILSTFSDPSCGGAQLPRSMLQTQLSQHTRQQHGMQGSFSSDTEHGVSRRSDASAGSTSTANSVHPSQQTR